jgi:hypothetical protein
VSGSGSEPAADKADKERESSFRLEISLAIGYQRRRAVLGGAFEGHVVTLGLLIGGIAVAVLVVWALFQLAEKLPI